jgi:hypothetical protein
VFGRLLGLVKRDRFVGLHPREPRRIARSIPSKVQSPVLTVQARPCAM